MSIRRPQRTKQGEFYYYQARKGCKSLVKLAEADRLAEMYLPQRFDANERTISRIMPGHGHADEIAEVTGHPRTRPGCPDFASKHAELITRLRELQALPAVPARIEKVGTGETVEQFWHRQDDAGKRQMLIGVLQAYYRRDWRGEGGPTDSGVRFMSGGLTPREAIERLCRQTV